jgi:two-component system OmpR family sensor kinase
MIRSFRVQLTAWYLLFFTALFLLFSVFLYGLLSKALYRRLDQRLSSEVNTAAGLFQGELKELSGDASGAALESVSEMRVRGMLLAIFEAQQLLAASEPVAQRDLLAVVTQAGTAEVPATLARYGRNGARAAAGRFQFDGRQFVVLAVEPLDSVLAELQLARRVLYVSLPLVLLIAGVGGFLLAARSLAPVRSMAEQTRRITDKNLHSRLDIGAANEELSVLASSFNELLSRLDGAFESMRRFVADASHELRTPLAVIRGEADVALAHDRESGEYKESLAIIQDESQRLSRLVDDLLSLAQADAGRIELRLEELYLNDLLAECCRSVQALASAKHIELECRCPGDVVFQGDPELLRRLILNLLDNAIRYTPESGKVWAKLEVEDDDICIRVSDTGVGIPPEAAQHVFQRFYRVDSARSRQHGGFGLGLSIVKWIAESHHGKVELSSQPGIGSTFTVLLHR